MASSIAIPRRKKKLSVGEVAGSSSASSASSFSYGSFGSVRAVDTASNPQTKAGQRRPSLMSPAFYKAEHTVVNIGNSDNPRLITCVKASQGFDWNQEIFLPSYMNFDFDSLERKQDPVHDIVVTDEEVAAMFPS